MVGNLQAGSQRETNTPPAPPRITVLFSPGPLYGIVPHFWGRSFIPISVSLETLYAKGCIS